VADLGEKRLLREVLLPLTASPRQRSGVGDDAAVLKIPKGSELVVSTDKIPENLLALEFGLLDAYHHGRYLAEANLSDLAAMGAYPLGLLVTLAVPDDFEIEYLRDFMQGFGDAARRWDADVLGGDTGWASIPLFSATAVGAVPAGGALTRSGASAGDDLFVSGTVGDFGAALLYYASAGQRGGAVSTQHEQHLRERLTAPRARIELAGQLRRSGTCSSCMDITDGLGQSLRELTEASNLGAEINTAAVPIHDATRAVADLLQVDVLDVVFGMGLDLELVGSLRASGSKRNRSLDCGITVIGEMTDDPGISLRIEGQRRPLPDSGWQHFTRSALDQVRALAKPNREGRSR
jgi:thiamine-monophosphate kinase